MEHIAGFVLAFGVLNLLTFFVVLFKRCGDALSDIDVDDVVSMFTIIRQEFTMTELKFLDAFFETGKVMIVFGIVFLMF